MKQIAHPTFSIVVVAVCFLFLESCRCGFYKCDDDPHPQPPEELIGKWQYIRYWGGFGGIDSTVTNQNWYLTLYETGNATETRNGNTLYNGSYYVYNANDGVLLIHLNNTFDKQIYLKSDTLSLRDYQVDDGFEFLLVKRN